MMGLFVYRHSNRGSKSHYDTITIIADHIHRVSDSITPHTGMYMQKGTSYLMRFDENPTKHIMIDDSVRIGIKYCNAR